MAEERQQFDDSGDTGGSGRVESLTVKEGLSGYSFVIDALALKKLFVWYTKYASPEQRDYNLVISCVDMHRALIRASFEREKKVLEDMNAKMGVDLQTIIGKEDQDE
jgi:hypothetical protein